MAQTKKKHISKKTRSGWKKVNIDDVEDFLEEKRFEERIGFSAEKPDEELFQVDVVEKPKKQKLSVREIRKLRAQKPPRCFQALENTSKVQDPITKRNRVKTPEERKHPLLKLKIQKRKEQGILTAREKQSIKDRLEAGKKIRTGKKKGIEFNKDLWGEDEEKRDKATDEEETDDESMFTSRWLSDDLKKYTKKNIGQGEVEVPQIAHEKRKKIEAIEKPLPGLSYNPTESDFKELVDTVVEKEEQLIRKKVNLDRVLKPLFTPISKSELRKRRREEMLQGLPIEGAESEDSAEEDENVEYKALNPPVRNKKKDTRQRRKQKEFKLRRAQEEKAKQELKKIKDLNTLKKFKKEAKKVEEQVEKQREIRIKKNEQKKFEPGRLARLKFIEEDLPVPDAPEDLGNLRRLKPEGNLLMDRFKSLQKRNILPVNKKRQKKNRQLVTVKKRGYNEQQAQTRPVKAPKTPKMTVK